MGCIPTNAGTWAAATTSEAWTGWRAAAGKIKRKIFLLTS